MTTTTDILFKKSPRFPLTINVDHLKHFLLNAKAQRWMICEWFYSDIDWCLLTTENEFENCMEYFFPEFNNNNNNNNNNSKKRLEFTRHQWNLIRRRFGKPRRLSSAYLKNERIKLSKQRNLLRILQYETKTHYQSEKIFLNNLPSLIISPLPIGSHVIVRLFRSSQYGLYRGQFISRDENNNQLYKILFDDSNIGLLNVNDYDVMSEEPLEHVGLGDKLKTIKFGEKDKEYLNSDNDEDLQTTDDDEMAIKTDVITKVPDRLLYLIIRVSRILCAKRDSIESLRKMNDQAEFETSRQIPLSDAFRRDYAHLIQWLAKLNEFLAKFIDEINNICREIVTDEQLLVVFNDTKFVCDRSQRLAQELVNKLNIPSMVINEGNLELITKLVALIVQMKEFSESEGSFLELHALDEANANFKKFIHPSLLSTYKQCVESSVTQFKSGLNNRPGLGLLQSFLHTQSESNDQQTNNSSINQTFFSL
ncbi:unnamed protein product [Rotaria sordida]|uniref:DIRP domain-containing protein n=1 Tax=Rotaria sordida TaxID=392033 RepID=A0A814J337_9BILA|nr:unnamed protein product [Rotaria sordida]